jgi:hypothetical protein
LRLACVERVVTPRRDRSDGWTSGTQEAWVGSRSTGRPSCCTIIGGRGRTSTCGWRRAGCCAPGRYRAVYRWTRPRTGWPSRYLTTRWST